MATLFRCLIIILAISSNSYAAQATIIKLIPIEFGTLKLLLKLTDISADEAKQGAHVGDQGITILPPRTQINPDKPVTVQLMRKEKFSKEDTEALTAVEFDVKTLAKTVWICDLK